jgi:hypothetical protein
MSKISLDPVAMKHEIQRRLRRRYKGVSWADRNRIIRKAVERDPHLSKLVIAEDGKRKPADTVRNVGR